MNIKYFVSPNPLKAINKEAPLPSNKVLLREDWRLTLYLV
ncbi:hypothetical protein VCHA52P453_50173 [Vibrio chagasii]|nr:hypothetical protein VCHA39P226_50047 [Vibrio chagasii]CAH7371383.1 hypothetical protein VCHA52P453_50173 [Vibrio chagasii]